MSNRSLARVFAIPAVLFGVSLAGLVLALLADGLADFAWAAAVGVPVAAIAWAMARRRT